MTVSFWWLSCRRWRRAEPQSTWLPSRRGTDNSFVNSWCSPNTYDCLLLRSCASLGEQVDSSTSSGRIPWTPANTCARKRSYARPVTFPRHLDVPCPLRHLTRVSHLPSSSGDRDGDRKSQISHRRHGSGPKTTSPAAHVAPVTKHERNAVKTSEDGVPGSLPASIEC